MALLLQKVCPHANGHSGKSSEIQDIGKLGALLGIARIKFLAYHHISFWLPP